MSCKICLKKNALKCTQCFEQYCSMKCFGDTSHKCITIHWENIKEQVENQQIEKKFIYSDTHCEIALYSVSPSGSVPREIHTNATQIIRVESGIASITLNDSDVYILTADSQLVVPANTYHTIMNTSSKEFLKFSTIYTPAIHQ